MGFMARDTTMSKGLTTKNNKNELNVQISKRTMASQPYKEQSVPGLLVRTKTSLRVYLFDRKDVKKRGPRTLT